MPNSTTQLATKRDLEKLATKLEFKSEIKALETRLNKKLDKIINTLDGFVGRVDDLTTENAVGASQARDHEKRISKLESRIQSA